MTYRFFEAASVAIFAFGALTFATLSLYYWGEHLRGKRTRHAVLRAFTLVCAAAFLANLLSPFLPLLAVAAIRSLSAALLPPLIFHLVLDSEPARSSSRSWRAILTVFYGAAVVHAFFGALLDTGLLIGPYSDLLYRVPAASLATASVLSLAFLVLPRFIPRTTHARWLAALLALMLACALLSLADAGVYIGQIPDYLLLALFAVSLYYRERLVFFDVLMKRTLFLALGLAALTALIAAVTPEPGPATLWLYASGLLFWLSGPSVYALGSRAIDRFWLGRTFSPAEAERRFHLAIQTAATEDELRTNAARVLTEIFRAPAHIAFDAAPLPAATDEALVLAIEHAGAQQGHIALDPRPGGVPYLSGDRSLLQSLATTLGTVLENVRVRAERHHQEEREQHLRLLASRAELKALRAQVNPHFLFNSLSVIAGLIQYRPDLADLTIERLAEVFRYTLRKSEAEWTPLVEEIEFVTAYLAIEQARFGDRLHVSVESDPAAARFPIPAMSIQPLVENAIKHGVSASLCPGAVTLRTALHAGRLSVEVIDTGPGFPEHFSLHSPGQSHGLRNVAERLRGYYGDTAALSWDRTGNCTRVALSFPQPRVANGDLA